MADLTSSLLSLGCNSDDTYRQQKEGTPSPSLVPERCKFSSLGFPSQPSLSLAILNTHHFCAASFDFYRGSLCQQWMCLIFSLCRSSFGAVEIPGDSASLQTVRGAETQSPETSEQSTASAF